MSSDKESDTVQASVPLLTEQGCVPETQHNEFQFVAEENNNYETSHDERQLTRKNKRCSQPQKENIVRISTKYIILLNLIVDHVIRRFLQQKELIQELFLS